MAKKKASVSVHYEAARPAAEIYATDDDVAIASLSAKAAQRVAALRQREADRAAALRRVDPSAPTGAALGPVDRAAIRRMTSRTAPAPAAKPVGSVYDLWDDDTYTTAQKVGQAARIVYRGETLGIEKPTLHRDIPAPQQAGAVLPTVAPDGLSYNPAVDAHEKVIATAAHIVRMQEEKKDINALLAARRPAAAAAAAAGAALVADAYDVAAAVVPTELREAAAAAFEAAQAAEKAAKEAGELSLGPGVRVPKTIRRKRHAITLANERAAAKAANAAKHRGLLHPTPAPAPAPRPVTRTRGGKRAPGEHKEVEPEFQLAEDITGTLRSSHVGRAAGADLFASQLDRVIGRNMIEYRTVKPHAGPNVKYFTPLRHRITAEDLGVDKAIITRAEKQVQREKSAEGRKKQNKAKGFYIKR